MRRYPKLVAFVAGLVSATGFAPLDLWPVTIAAFAVMMWLVGEAPNLRGALARGYVFGLGHFIVGLNWIAGAFRFQEVMPVWLGWVAVVALAIYIAVYPAMAAGLAWRWGVPRRSVVYVLVFAAAWIVTEWLRATMFTGFAWNPLGVVFVPTSVDGLASVIGTYALSGVAILCAGALAHARRISALPLTLGGALALGWATTALRDNLGTTSRLIRVVQPNIGQQDKHKPAFDRVNFQRLASLTGKPGAEPRLILWPEAAVPYFLEEEAWARQRIARLMGPRDVIMTGGDALVFGRGGRLIAARNSVFTMDARGRLLGRYDKSHLVPYGEYLPMRPLLTAIGLSRLVPGDLDFLAGPGAQSFALPGFGNAGVQICYEIIFSGDVVRAEARPGFLFNPSNDAWFGRWGPPQHLAQARLRAIEEGMPVVRSTPTGISAVIDARGRLLVALPLGKAGFIQTRIPAVGAPTLFARVGVPLSFLFAGLLVVSAIALRRRPS